MHNVQRGDESDESPAGPGRGAGEGLGLPRVFLPASRPRPPPRDRGRSGPQQAEPAPRRPSPQGLALDPAAPRSPPNPLYTKAWKELCSPDISRPARITAWRVMHGCLMVGAFRYHVFKNPDALPCPLPACASCPATLSHVFLECPVVLPVLQYVQKLWALLDPAAQPLLPVALLTGDPRSWSPSALLHPLWVRLRVYYVQAVWAGVQRARGPASHTSSTAITAALLHSCHTNLLQDWALATSGFRDPEADQPSSQLSGLPASISKEHFFAKWGGAGVLCAEPEPDRLRVLWSLRYPVDALSLGGD